MDIDTFEDVREKVASSRMGKPALVGIAVVIVMVAVLAGHNILDTATASEFTLERAGVSGPAESVAVGASSESGSGGADANPGGSGDSASAEVSSGTAEVGSPGEVASDNAVAGGAGAQEHVFVHVSGCVESPGLYELEGDSRVGDAVDAAGGVSADGALDSVNLAQRLSDGEKVVVLSRDEYERLRNAGDADAGDSEGARDADGSADSGIDVAQSGGLVNINTASEAELETLPGVGPSTAQKIVAERDANGPFEFVEDITRVSGIGEKKLESIRDLICV